MVILVRCPDTTVSVALASQLELLMSEGLITAYLGPQGWVAATTKRPGARSCPATPEKRRVTAFVSCF
jgi:hypothetical protein